MYANQPEEGSNGLTDAQIVEIAKNAGVTMTSDLEDAITSHRYLAFVQAQSLPDGSTGTPTVVVNGEIVDVTDDVQTDIVDRLK